MHKHTQSSLKPPLQCGKKKGKPTAAATAAQTRYLSSPAAATLHGKTQGFVLRLPPQNRALATFMQPFQCDLQPQLQQTHRTTHTGTTIVAKHTEGTKRPQPHPPHTRGTFHRRLQPLYTEETRFRALASSPQHCPCNIHAAMTMRSEGTDSKTPYNYQAQAHPKQLEATLTMRQKKRQTDRSRNRRTDEVPFIAGCSHFTRKNTRFRAPASSRKQSPCNIMQPFQCDLQAQFRKHPITTHTQAHPTQLEATVTIRQKKKANRPQPQPPHRRGTFHRRLQPLYTEKHKVSFFGFLPKTEPMQHHAAITMRSATTDSKTPYNYACTSTPKAAWSHRYNAAKKKANRPQPQPPHTRGTFRRQLQPLYTEKHKVSCSGFLPTTLPMQHSCSHDNAICLQPPFIKVKSQSHTTLQGQVSIAHHPSHHPSRSSGQVSIAHHPFSIAHHPSRSSLNRTPPFKVKCQSRTTLHHFKTQNSICPYLGSIASQLPLIMVRGPVCCILIQFPHWFLHRCRFLVIARYCRFSLLESTCLSRR